MNALEAASLVMIPSGYENGTLGSLKPTDGTGDFTFSRGSDISATRVNEDGYIEKGYENLFLQSNSFLTTWTTTSGTSITSGQSGYDGSSDAWLLETTSDGIRYLQQLISVNSVQSISIYAKSGTTDFLGIQIIGGGYSFFNLSNGTLGSSSSVVIDKSIELVNGTTDWYRCSFVINANTTAIRIYPTNADNNFASTTGQNIYIQDAMLNQGMVSYPYVETTTAPVAGGILEDMPRLDYSGSCPALLLEPQRTNLFPYSEYFGDANIWNNINVILSSNAAISPEGLNNATKLVESTGNTFHFIEYNGFIGTSAPSYCSFYAKPAELTSVSVFMSASGNNGVVFDLENVTATPTLPSLSGYIEPVGNGWFKCVASNDGAQPLNNRIRIGPRNGAIVSYNGDGTSGVYIWGAQLEQDATYPTSYIPTYGTSQTRLGDLATGAGDATSINSTEGTLYAELSFADDTSFKFISLNSGSSTNRVSFYSSSPSTISVNVKNTAGNQFNGNFSIDSTINHKIAVKYKENDFALWIDGQERLSDSSGTTFPPSTLTQLEYDGGNANSPFNGIVKQLLVFPTALSDDECIELTTI